MASLHPKRNAYRVHLWFGPDWFVRSLQGYFSDTIIVKQSLKIWGNVLYECTKIARTDHINTINQEQYNNKTKHNIIVCVLYGINYKNVSLSRETILKITIKASEHDPEGTPHRTPTTQIILTHKSRYILFSPCTQHEPWYGLLSQVRILLCGRHAECNFISLPRGVYYFVSLSSCV